MKNLIFTVLFLFSSIILFARGPAFDSHKSHNIIQGKVKDEISGEPLTGVSIKIIGLNETQYTDFDGGFSFKDLQPGKYTLIIETISYKKKIIKEINMTTDSHDKLDIKLEPVSERFSHTLPKIYPVKA